MGRITTVLVLTVLDASALHLGVDVLIVGASQGSIDDLNALANTQHGNLTVISQTSQEELLKVTLRSDAVEFLDRFLA